MLNWQRRLSWTCFGVPVAMSDRGTALCAARAADATQVHPPRLDSLRPFVHD